MRIGVCRILFILHLYHSQLRTYISHPPDWSEPKQVWPKGGAVVQNVPVAPCDVIFDVRHKYWRQSSV